MTIRARLIAAALCSLVLASLAAAASAAPPPGATAQCKDGTYSFSTHHAGTCSGHHGVATWLTGTGTMTTPTSTTTPAPTPSPSPLGPVSIGNTVLLSPRTKTSGCALGPNPDPRCSPGAYYSGLSKAVLCSSSFHTGDVRNVPDSEKHAVEIEYGMTPKPYGRTIEIDHIVSLELGGSNDIANLYPEQATLPNHAPGYHKKDLVENAAHHAVCSSAITLRAAQHEIATNWELLYKELLGAAPTA